LFTTQECKTPEDPGTTWRVENELKKVKLFFWMFFFSDFTVILIQVELLKESNKGLSDEISTLKSSLEVY
jgi:hypothetical protein